MTLLLDTHAIVWWLAGEARFSRPQFAALQSAEDRSERFAVAAVSLWEIAWLGARGRLVDPEQRIRDIESEHGLVDVLPLTGRIAIDAAALGRGFPGDPVDRLIAATARVYGMTLVTADRRIRASGVVPVI